jgi:hypothetical protein
LFEWAIRSGEKLEHTVELSAAFEESPVKIRGRMKTSRLKLTTLPDGYELAFRYFGFE